MDSSQVAEFESLAVGSYCQIAAIALVLYDDTLTIKDEIRYFGGKKWTGATVLFWLNKWLVIIYYTFSLATGFEISDARCAALAKLLLTLVASMYTIWGLFTALRTYALCTNWFIAAMIFLLHAVSIGVNMSQFAFGITGVNLPLIHCVETDSTPLHLAKLFTVISRTALLLANFLAIGVTWFTMHKDRGFGYAEDSRRTLAGVLLWDGFVYFITIAIVDAMHMIITLLSINQLLTGSISDITVFSFPLSAIIISRFMLHLQGANSRTTGMASDSQEPTASNIGSLMFERAFGSLGASISPDNFFATEEDDACDEMEMEESNATEGGGRNPQSDVT